MCTKKDLKLTKTQMRALRWVRDDGRSRETRPAANTMRALINAGLVVERRDMWELIDAGRAALAAYEGAK